MAKLNIQKVTELPVVLEPSTIYFVRGAGDDEFLDIYVTGINIDEVRHVITRNEIASMISTQLSGIGTPQMAINISSRDALELSTNAMVLVNDATGDPTVSSGAALYFYSASLDEFIKVAEYESMDLVLDWDDIQNKPLSPVAAIDASVTQTHSHSNINVLANLAESVDGELEYNGVALAKQWDVEGW